MPQIAQIHAEGELPFVVGGTSYYVQNLLMPGGLVRDVAPDLPGAGKSISQGLSLSPSELSSLTSPKEVLSRYDESLATAFKSLPDALLELVLLLPSLPSFSSPSSYPPDFPIHLLPPEYRPPSSTAENLSAALHSALQVVDPDVARRWHWRNLRKNRRSLEVAVCTGKRMSEVMEEQEHLRSSDEAIPPPCVSILWKSHFG